MEPIEFRPWAKIPRLNRLTTITEKLDGTSAAVGIVTLDGHSHQEGIFEVRYAVGLYAQSRTRIITPTNDNHGFARWAYENAATLVADLGPGLHFGEWWGSGINRGYGLTKGEKRFSLFNTERWGEFSSQWPDHSLFTTPGLDVVPILDVSSRFDTQVVNHTLNLLRANGSYAAPGFDRPEGVVAYHKASRSMFKVTLENDESPKSLDGAGTPVEGLKDWERELLAGGKSTCDTSGRPLHLQFSKTLLAPVPADWDRDRG